MKTRTERATERFNDEAVRCDTDGLPKLVQYMKYNDAYFMFELTLIDGTEVHLSADQFGVGLFQRKIPNETYAYVENWYLQHRDWFV